ncbi:MULTISPECIES: D-2-hydroxyacid dehydrogenase family protein [unclassified Nocardioides]|uniref:D-2-hydroxyacid dehydrogenase family protein n=1 Tax=unclassified Nocardioides TaxID=2615069 RepID=UPI0006FEB40F|nr:MULTISPECIES: D-2-hydroxyacid dehydrogenase family protein [unclassified Nocardioides]KQY64379.1 hydroxyacid dehydrogenase [Nocardioides sp. Root140]KRF18150.1 hydroxyacid dehydrogenase [Nocardioides sp. Soil796]
MTLRCAVLDDYQAVAEGLADWATLDDVQVRFLHDHLPDEDACAETLADADILVVMRERTPITATLLARLPRLKLVVTSGLRNASIDLDAARARGVVVCGTPSASEPPTELTWALVLGLARGLHVEVPSFASGGPWQSTLGADLHGAVLGVVGLGKIGSRVARIGQAFGMDVVAWSPHLTDERCAEVGVRRAADLPTLLAESDFTTLHLVLAEATRGIIGRAELAAMKPSAFLVNTSRAGLVDTPALVEALQDGRLAGAGLDVFDTEPLPFDDALRGLPNVLATPHLGYVTRRNYAGYFTGAVEDIAAWQAGSPVRLLT